MEESAGEEEASIKLIKNYFQRLDSRVNIRGGSLRSIVLIPEY